MKRLKEAIHQYLKKHPPSLRLFQMLEKTGDIYLIGGVLREFKDNEDIKELRDIDIVIDIKIEENWKKILCEFQTDRNTFGGYKLVCSNLIVDVWPLEETWAYRNHIIQCDFNEYAARLEDTVFLNIDAIIYDLKNDIWYDKGYRQAMQSGILDVVLTDNPQVPLNIVRAMILRKQYNMEYSKILKAIMKRETDADEEFANKLLLIQNARYKRELLTIKEIEEELAV